MQASGYGSGDHTYEDMEGRDEVKKVVEERQYTMVFTVQTHTQTQSRLSAAPPVHWGWISTNAKGSYPSRPEETGAG